MFDSARVKQDFSRAARQYDQNATLQQHVLSQLLEKIRPLLNKNIRILDAGCGTGQLSRILGNKDIIQIDIAREMCKTAVYGNPVVNGDIESLPFASHSFDLVFSSLVFQWLSDSRNSIEEIMRVTKPQGLIAISTLGEGTLRELRESFAHIDNYPHISPFIKADDWERETVTEYMPSLYAIMQKLKAVGAANKLAGRRKSVMTRGQMQAMETYYRKNFGCEKGLRVTWEVLYCVEESRRFHHFR